MKTLEELYVYCVRTNIRTKNWIASMEMRARSALAEWPNSAEYYIESGYSLRKLNSHHTLGPAGDLWRILVNECHEEARYVDVCLIADRILQDIGWKLSREVQRYSDYIVYRVNNRGEVLLFIGPHFSFKDLLFSNDGIFMKAGYDVLVEFLRMANEGYTMQEVAQYLSRSGFQIPFF